MYPRASGLLMHIASLPSSGGIGDLGAAAFDFVELLVRARQQWWQVLPLNPTSEESGNSPYFSSSAFAGNPLLIDLHGVVGAGYLQAGEIEPFEGSDPHGIDYEGVRRFKMPLLMRAYERFASQCGHEGFNRFCEEEADWLDDYALFMVIRSLQGQQRWDRWPEPLRNREDEALEQVRTRYAAELRRERFLQWLFFEQWYRLRRHCNGVGIRLVGDVPIYVSYDSADVWAHRTMFKLDKNAQPTGVSGVPPDYFSATGQLWNNPVYDWDALKQSGYRWWIQRMKATFERFDIVRIDHFRGLVQYWEVAAGERTAINGKWMDVPTRDFFDTMLSHIPGFPVIAEDLGIITDDVREVMNHYGLPGMKVLLFAFGSDEGNHPYLPHSFERNCIVYTGTHDNNTIRGWFEQEATEQDKERLFTYLGRTLAVEELCGELTRVALASVADIAILAVQDVLCLGGWARMNNPSTVHNNWRWRLTKDEFARLPAERLAQLCRSYGRVPPELSKARVE